MIPYLPDYKMLIPPPQSKILRENSVTGCSGKILSNGCPT